MKFVLVHGFNIRDGGKNTIDKLAPFIRTAGHEVDLDEGDYGYFNLFMIRFIKSKQRTRVMYRLARAFETADVIITHSNGANFSNQALELLPIELNNSKLLIHISAALNTDTDIPKAVKAQLVLYTPHDGWVKLSSYLPFHPWGRMGARGYTGPANHNSNIMDARVKKHSQWFNDTFAKPTWGYCNSFVLEHSP